MAGKAMLKFVRGLDLSGTNFEDSHFPNEISQLCNVRWMRLDRSGLDMIPTAVNSLQKLEYLSLQSNKLLCVPPSVKQLKNLRTLRASKNDLDEADISPDLFALDDLSTLDLSHNRMTKLPEHMAAATDMLVLSLGYNKISEIPSEIFVNLTDLEYLDVGNNRIALLPPQLRRLNQLKTLILSNNPLENDKLLSLQYLENLTRLELRNTGRTEFSLPVVLADLEHLRELDISNNGLEKVPQVIHLLENLTRLDLCDNNISELSNDFLNLQKLRSLNLSRNQLKRLPAGFGQLHELQILYLSNNRLDELPDCFEEMPELRKIHLAGNRLHALPPSLLHCQELTWLDIRDNRLEYLPEEIHFLPKLQKGLKHDGNPNLKVAPKPIPPPNPDLATYFVDFSNPQPKHSDVILKEQKSRFQCKIDVIEDPDVAELNLKSPEKKTKKLASRAKLADKITDNLQHRPEGDYDVSADAVTDESLSEELNSKTKKSKSPAKQKWQMVPERADYASLFGEDAGDEPGIRIWRLENFYPIAIPDVEYGQFYEADCYIILETLDLDTDPEDQHRIFFWVGQKSSIDKKASAAIHAVHLRNHVRAKGTQREDQDDESREFLKIFDNNISYIQGGTDCGFFEMELPARPARLFLLLGNRSLCAFAVPRNIKQLHQDHVFALDAQEERVVYLWAGSKVPQIRLHKARLFCERIVNTEDAKIIEIAQGSEPAEFLSFLVEDDDDDEEEGKETVLHAKDFGIEFSQPRHLTKLLQLKLGDNCLELPQMVHAGRDLHPSMLDTNNVYLLDDFSHIYIWVGRKASRLVQAASSRVAEMLADILSRPDHFLISVEREGVETVMFKSKFKNWDDVIHGDFRQKDIIEVEKKRNARLKSLGLEDGPASRPATPLKTTFPRQFSNANSPLPIHMLSRQLSSSPPVGIIRRRNSSSFSIGSNPVITDFDPPQVELSELFSPPPRPLMTEDEAREREDEWLDDLQQRDIFILRGTEAARLDPNHTNHFFTAECYIVLCRQWIVVEAAGETDSEDEDDGPLEQLECVAYFWQGRDSNRTAFHQFCFSQTRSKLNEMSLRRFKRPLRIELQHQQQETMRFLALFDREIVIHNGKFPEGGQLVSQDPELYHLHQSTPSTFTRTIQIPCVSSRLNSGDCFLMKVPFDNAQQGVLYVWQGAKAPYDLALTAAEIAKHSIWGKYSIQIVREGSEPKNFFWPALKVSNPPGDYNKNQAPFNECRLFKCLFINAVFEVKEFIVEFCQDDLDDDKVYILDNTKHLFLWVGPYASDVALKLANGAALEYLRRSKRTFEQTTPTIVYKNCEPLEFQLSFHAWSHHTTQGYDLDKHYSFVGQVISSDYARAKCETDENCPVIESEGLHPEGPELKWQPGAVPNQTTGKSTVESEEKHELNSSIEERKDELDDQSDDDMEDEEEGDDDDDDDDDDTADDDGQEGEDIVDSLSSVSEASSQRQSASTSTHSSPSKRPDTANIESELAKLANSDDATFSKDDESSESEWEDGGDGFQEEEL